jgi:hypothetical protein
LLSVKEDQVERTRNKDGVPEVTPDGGMRARNFREFRAVLKN